MRDLTTIDAYRMKSAELRVYGVSGDATCGAFMMQSPIDKQGLTIVASSDQGWDHVSVSRTKRCPNWQEMEFVKRQFFKDDEVAMQLHVPPAQHINLHPNCLHLFRPHNVPIPLPPDWMVGPKDESEVPEMIKQMRGG